MGWKHSVAAYFGADKDPEKEERFCVYHSDVLGQRDHRPRRAVFALWVGWGVFCGRHMPLDCWVPFYLAWGASILLAPFLLEKRSKRSYLANRENIIFFARLGASIAYLSMADWTAPHESKLQILLMRIGVPMGTALAFKLRVPVHLLLALIELCVLCYVTYWQMTAPGAVGSVLEPTTPDNAQFQMPIVGLAFGMPALIVYLFEAADRFRFGKRERDMRLAQEAITNRLSSMQQQVDSMQEMLGATGAVVMGGGGEGGDLRKRK